MGRRALERVRELYMRKGKAASSRASAASPPAALAAEPGWEGGVQGGRTLSAQDAMACVQREKEKTGLLCALRHANHPHR